MHKMNHHTCLLSAAIHVSSMRRETNSTSPPLWRNPQSGQHKLASNVLITPKGEGERFQGLEEGKGITEESLMGREAQLRITCSECSCCVCVVGCLLLLGFRVSAQREGFEQLQKGFCFLRPSLRSPLKPLNT